MPNFQVSKISRNANKQALQKTLIFMHQQKNTKPLDPEICNIPQGAEEFIQQLSTVEPQEISHQLLHICEAFVTIVKESNLSENEKIKLYEALQRDPMHFDNLFTNHHRKVIKPIFGLLTSLWYVLTGISIYKCIIEGRGDSPLGNDFCDVPQGSLETLYKIFWFIIFPSLVSCGISEAASDKILEMGLNKKIFSTAPITKNADAFGVWMRNIAKTVAEIESAEYKDNPKLKELEFQLMAYIKDQDADLNLKNKIKMS